MKRYVPRWATFLFVVAAILSFALLPAVSAVAAGALDIGKSPFITAIPGPYPADNPTDFRDDGMARVARAAMVEAGGYNDAGYFGSNVASGSMTWDGTSGITSSAAAADYRLINAQLTAVAIAPYADLQDVANVVFPDNTWGGEAVNRASILAKYTYAGDATMDSVINLNDVSALIAGIGRTSAGKAVNWATGDFNYDGFVNLTDVSILISGIGKQTQYPIDVVGSSSPTSVGQAVPEPGTFALVGAGVLVLGFWFRRKSTLSV